MDYWGGGGGGKGMLAPFQIICGGGGAGPLPPPFPTPMLLSKVKALKG